MSKALFIVASYDKLGYNKTLIHGAPVTHHASIFVGGDSSAVAAQLSENQTIFNVTTRACAGIIEAENVHAAAQAGGVGYKLEGAKK